MRLAEFIRSEMETILAEWEAFAATLLPAAANMSALALRDHAPHILEAVALDISTPQTADQQSEKSMGRAPQPLNAAATAAQTHAMLRARSGFDINQLAAEYRAMRASVLRLWTAKCPPTGIHPEDVTRFNEAIDQALMESIRFFSDQVDRSRNLLLGMLSHDMRSPLNAVVMTAHYLAELNAGAEVSEAASTIINSGAAMKALLDDLLDFNRSKLGLGINVQPTDTDLARLFTAEVDLQRHAHPGRRIELHTEGNLAGRWDGARIQQVLRNLLSNAMQHGGDAGPVIVTLTGKDAGVHFEVRNEGPAIELSSYEEIFDPLRRGPTKDGDNPYSASLGLGLYIVREVVKAHGGQIEVRSIPGETVFAVELPRHASPRLLSTSNIV